MVVGVRHATESKGQPTFLYLNRPYPAQPFSVVIFHADRYRFEKPPETLFAGKTLCVTGTIASQQGKPQIVVNQPSQIQVK